MVWVLENCFLRKKFTCYVMLLDYLDNISVLRFCCIGWEWKREYDTIQFTFLIPKFLMLKFLILKFQNCK